MPIIILNEFVEGKLKVIPPILHSVDESRYQEEVKPLTLIEGMYYDNGNGAVIVSDSRTMIGPDMRSDRKIFDLVGGRVIFAAAGLTGIIDRLLPRIENRIAQARVTSLDEAVDVIEDTIAETSFRYKHPNRPRFHGGQTLVEAIVGGIRPDGKPILYLVHEIGYAEPIRDCRAIGEGSRHATNILNSLYKANVTRERAIEIGVHAIICTSKIDTLIDDNPQIAVIENNRCAILNRDDQGRFQIQKPEITNIKEKINGISEKQSMVFNLMLNGSEELKAKFETLLKEYQSHT